MHSGKKERILKYKILYTVLILLVYVLGKGLPLYMIDVSAYMHRNMDAEGLLLQTISGDIYQCSVFALGISPFMIASLFTQILSAFRSAEIRAKISPFKMNRVSLILSLIIAMLQAFVLVQDLQFRVTGSALEVAKFIAVIELVAGATIIMWLTSRNKKYGIGGQTALIYLNILDGILTTVQGNTIRSLVLPILLSVVVLVIMIVMENAEKRIPVQRISIHNIYADKNYMAIKLNPIGVMPAMFSMAFFMVPQLLISLFIMVFPENAGLLWVEENMVLTKPLGIAVYVIILYTLTVGFSRVFLNPKDITEQFLKSGDSIQGIHAGKDTKRYLSRVINRISMVSATVMSSCLLVPLVLQVNGRMDSSLATLPSSVMMLTGIWCNLYREILAIKDLEAYEPFI
jgi:preprotein translocase subunit SecY